MSKKRKPKTKADETKPTDYEVGYGKPPVHSRWGPGQSGNPGGRKSGQRNFKTMVLEVFEAEIEVTESGRRSKCTVAKALLLTMVQGGLKDRDIRAITRALELYERYADKPEDNADKENDPTPEHDLDIIRRAMGADALGEADLVNAEDARGAGEGDEGDDSRDHMDNVRDEGVDHDGEVDGDDEDAGR